MSELLFGTIPAAMVADWVAAARGWDRLRVLSKPLAMGLLLIWFVQSVERWEGGTVFTAFGLAFSLLGDVFLLREVEKRNGRFFLAGVGAFLAAQVFYIGAFNWPAQYLAPDMLPLALLVAGWGWFYGRRLLAKVSAGRCVPLGGYILAISLMLLSGLSTLFRPEWPPPAAWLAASGAVLFYVSDSILAYQRFVRRLWMGELGVMVTYHLAQVGIAAGMLLRYGG